MLSTVCRQFSLVEIERATAEFVEVLGKGGEGTVYLGLVSPLGKVAVKRLKPSVEFEQELKIFSKIRHPHLVSLHGYCEESGEKMLVYEYMGKGSLADYISKKSSSVYLSWHQRLNICIGAARGLRHLHTPTETSAKGIIHRDVKPNNILLDDNWVAKVSDFGICKLDNKSTINTQIRGTAGYFAPEYVKNSTITSKIDVYAFGVVLFEVLCKKKPWVRDDESYSLKEDDNLRVWARDNVDLQITDEIADECLWIFTSIIGKSLQLNPSKRPTMDIVVMDLESALKCQERFRFKPSTSGRKDSILSSVRKMFPTIEKITEQGEVDYSNDTTTVLPESSNTSVLDSDSDITVKEQILQVEAWGSSSSANSWTYLPKESRISQISVIHSDAIYSLIFTSKDTTGALQPSKRFGNANHESTTTEINIDAENENLNGISGTVGLKKGRPIITSLSFTTDRGQSFCPFGIKKGTPFSLPMQDCFICGFHGNHRECAESIGVYVLRKPYVRIEPWGYPHFAIFPWTYESIAGKISHISITHADVIYSLIFASKDANGNFYRSKELGKKGFDKTDEVAIDTENNERVNGISGTFHNYRDSKAITSLSFYTNRNKSFGPFGKVSGTPFSITEKEIIGFHGSNNREWLQSIGVYVQHKPIVTEKQLPITFGRWGHQCDDHIWYFLPEGLICHIFITHDDDAIRSLIFRSEDIYGNLEQSSKYGGGIGIIKSEVSIDVKNEKLNGIKGTYGPFSDGRTFLTSLAFTTDNGRMFGPFGTGIGTKFSLSLKNGFISGFHGNFDDKINSIGVISNL